MRMTIAAITAATLLSACAPALYSGRHGQSTDQFKIDSYRCVQESRTSYGAGGTGWVGIGMIVGSAIAAKMQANGLYSQCMDAAGWSKPDKRASELAATENTPVTPSTPSFADDNTRCRAEAAKAKRQEDFFREFPDLREFADLANVVEQQTMQGLSIQGMSQVEWNKEVGTRVRQRIASTRGISLEQYAASLASRDGAAENNRAVEERTRPRISNCLKAAGWSGDVPK